MLTDFVCCICGKSFPEVSPYHQIIKGKHYYRSMCKRCDNARRTAKGFNANPQVAKRARRKYEANLRKKPTKRAKIIVLDCKKSDKKKGWCNDLTEEWVRAAIADGCIYCGAADIQLTLDRIDNSKPHTTDNVVCACIRCNLLRGSMPYQAWLRFIPTLREVVKEGLFEDWQGRAAGGTT